jgi:hypothetical protein
MTDDYEIWYERTKCRNIINAILAGIVVVIGFYLSFARAGVTP